MDPFESTGKSVESTEGCKIPIWAIHHVPSCVGECRPRAHCTPSRRSVCEVIGALEDTRAVVKVRQVVAVAQRLGQTQLVELLLEQVPVCNAETSAAVKGADLAPLYGATRRSSCARARPERAQRAGPASGPSLGVALSESWRPKRRAGGARTAGGSSRRGGNRNSRK